MSSYIIATSSTSDLPRTWLDEHNIPFISYSFTVNDQPAEDDCREESRAAIYAGMRRGDILKTSMINQFVYEDFFRGLLSQNKDVLFLDMSANYDRSVQNDELILSIRQWMVEHKGHKAEDSFDGK